MFFFYIKTKWYQPSSLSQTIRTLHSCGRSQTFIFTQKHDQHWYAVYLIITFCFEPNHMFTYSVLFQSISVLSTKQCLDDWIIMMMLRQTTVSVKLSKCEVFSEYNRCASGKMLKKENTSRLKKAMIYMIRYLKSPGAICNAHTQRDMDNRQYNLWQNKSFPQKMHHWQYIMRRGTELWYRDKKLVLVIQIPAALTHITWSN